MDQVAARNVAAVFRSQPKQIAALQVAALEAAANTIVITDRAGTIVWANSAFHQLTGYTSEEVTGQSTRILKSGTHPPFFYQNMWETILSDRVWQGRVVNKRKDGTLYDEEMTITPVSDGPGDITHFIAVKRDITDLTRAEERASRLLQAIQHSSDLVGLFNREGRFVFVNEALLKTCGYSQEDLLGKHFAAILSPKNPAAMVEAIATQGLETGGWNGECLVRRQDHTDLPTFLNAGPVKDAVGRVTGILGIARDMTERKKAEESLRSSEEQFRQLAENIREVFFAYTADPVRMTYISPAYEEVWGRPRQELYDRPAAWMESIHPEDRERVGDFYARCMQGSQSEMVYRVMRPDASVRWIHARSFPVRDSQAKLIRVVGIAEDITARKQDEEALQETHRELNSALVELKEQTQANAKLTEFVDILQSCESAEEAYKLAGTLLQSILCSASGQLCIINPSNDTLEAVADWGDAPGVQKAFRAEGCWALRRGKIHCVKDDTSPLRCTHTGKALANGHVCVPLVAQGETFGVLFAQYLAEPTGSAADVQRRRMLALDHQAAAVAERISLALANLKLREVLRGQSVRDPLTGLFNRRFMEESLERELRRATRENQPLAVLMLDVDHFKHFNDMFGHQAGDLLLRSVGAVFINRTRGQDVVCRYGGEEFTWVLPGSTLEAARQRAETLRAEIKQLTVEHAGHLLGAVTLSIGIAVFPRNGDTAAALLKAADNALYQAKEEGRDRVIAVAPAEQNLRAPTDILEIL